MSARERFGWVFLVVLTAVAATLGTLWWGRPGLVAFGEPVPRSLPLLPETVICVDFDERGVMVVWSAVSGVCREEDRPGFRRRKGI